MKTILAGAMIAIAVLFIAVCIQYGSKERTYPFAEEAKDGEYVRPTHEPGQGGDQKESSYFTVQVNAGPTVSRAGSRCNLMIGNPAENEQYAKVKLILDDTGEELFCSEILKPGERNAYVDLGQVPETGVHRTTAVFMVYDPENMEKITEIDASVLLTVK